MVRARKKSPEAKAAREPAPAPGERIDVNAIVSYNVCAIRERRGWTQEMVAAHLARLTGHTLPQASMATTTTSLR